MTEEYFDHEDARRKEAERQAEARVKRQEGEAMHRRVFGTEEGRQVLEILIQDLCARNSLVSSEGREALFSFAQHYLRSRLGVRNMAPIVDALLTETAWKAKE